MRAVLTYHSIDPSGSAISVPEEAFRAQVEFLASGRVRVVGLEEILSVPPSEDAVAITFDDGLESFGRIAAPLLLEHGLPATVFVIPEHVGKASDWDGEAPPGLPAVPVFDLLGWDALRELADAGVALGAHTLSHADLTRLDSEGVRRETEGSALRIEEETGRRPRSFAYPYGAHDDASVALVAGLFEVAVTVRFDLLRGAVDPHRVPRLDMGYFRDPERFSTWGTPAFWSYVSLRRGARWVRSVLSGGVA